MAEKFNPSSGCGRGGRGSFILEAVQTKKSISSIRSSHSDKSGENESSGYASQKFSRSLSRESSGSPIKSESSAGRGLRLARYIKTHETKNLTEGTGSLGRGRGDLNAIAKSLSKSSSVESSETKTSLPNISKLSLSQSSEDKLEPVYRQGTSGVPFEAITNWIPLLINSSKIVYEYNVQFNPPVDSMNLRFHLLNSQREKIGFVKSFDGAKLWLPTLLPHQVTELDAESKHNGEHFKISINFLTKLSMLQCIQLYNVLFNRIMKVLKYVLIGRNMFSPHDSVMIPQHQLEIWPGYITAVHHMEKGVMLCVDVAHRVLRCNTVHQVMGDIATYKKGNFQQEALKCLIGNIVLTRYNNKCYRIDDILFDSSPQATFMSSRGEEISYVDYYKKAYNIDIVDKCQPLLLHKARKKELKDLRGEKMICLIPELCYMTGLTDDMRSDFRIMKDLSQHTRLTPNARQACLRKFIRNVNDTPEAKQILSEWGLTLVDDNIKVTGRIVPAEPIIFGNRQIEGTPNADWGRDACREKVISPVDLQTGLWLIIFSARDESKTIRFIETMKQVTKYMGIFIGDPKLIKLSTDSTDAYVNKIKEYYNQKLQLVVVIFPLPREDRYSAVKRLTCSDLGVASQCINSRTISQDQKLRSVTQKIALQINCKLGGELWELKIPMSGLMVCGVDVYHNAIRKGNSVVGFVASLNPPLTRWYSNSLFQQPGEEIMNGLKNSLLESLRKYYEENHVLPKTIVIYRDGIGDGLLNITEEHEIPQLTSIFGNFEGYEPKFYFVVVNKRINTRIFASMSGRGLDNPPPGSVVDHTITKRYLYDFLLVSQHVRQGTVSPTHYIVLRDAEGLKPDHMQRLTYKLTHLYYNWPGTIRVPAPCQYAHKLAYLVGQNMKKEAHVALKDKLFFL